jgi:hypothetical protein
VGREVSRLQKKTSNRHTAKMLSGLWDLVEFMIGDCRFWIADFGLRIADLEMRRTV